MTPERWQTVEEVLQAALDCPAAERAAFISERCSGDHDLQQETLTLIQAYQDAGDFMEQPALKKDAQVLIAADDRDRIPREIGPYQIIELLGSGGMGEVYLAQDRRLNRPVALKILPPYFVSDEERLRRFQTEARAASALNHANILTIYEVGESAGIHYIAAEYIEGQTIRELIEADELCLDEVFEIVIQMLSGLDAAHANGIVHRDIKPENIMRRRDGVIRILDFGIAKLVEGASDSSAETSSWAASQTQSGTLLGTIGYVSPEQLRGLPVDQRTDIWSAGVVLYEMLAGQRPFAGTTNADTIVAILERAPTPLFPGNRNSATLQQLRRIVGKALQKQAADRYESFAQMLGDLLEARKQLRTAPARRANLDPQTRVSEIRARAASQTSTEYRHLFAALTVALLLVVSVVSVIVYRRSLSKARAASTPVAKKSYVLMSEAERLQFVSEQEQRVSALMGEGPMELNPEALNAIKYQIDRRVFPKDADAESLSIRHERAVPYIPVIADAFAARRIPIVVGVYLPMIESAYRPCYENSFGAKGLFQFVPQTARVYGVAPEDMCNVDKMAPAAAHYIADRMAELGDDAQSMTLVLVSYNRGAESVRDELRLLRETDRQYQRNFWTLFANRDKLDAGFRQESAYYVPSFFAAAIIGENPETFGLSTPALSSLAKKTR